MAKEKGIILNGVVLEALGGIRFKCALENGQEVLCTLSGKMHGKNFIRTNPGDKVQIEVCPYDLSRGRIIYRER
jgi:translation initiation factor IF-1